MSTDKSANVADGGSLKHHQSQDSEFRYKNMMSERSKNHKFRVGEPGSGTNKDKTTATS